MSLPVLTWGSLPFALLSILYVTVAGIGLTALYRSTFHPLARIPGPFLAKFTRLWHTKQYASGQWHDISLELHRKYGPVVRIAPDEVSFVDAEALKKMYSYAKPTLKSHWYKGWSHPKKTNGIFSIINIKEHARRRRQVANAYSMTSVLSAESLIQDVANICWKKFHQMAAANDKLNLDFWVTGFAYDVVGELAFGKSMKIMDLGIDEVGITEIILMGFKMMSILAHVPGQMIWFYNPVVSLLLKCFGEDPMVKFHNLVNARITERRKQGTPDRRDMLQQFLEAKTDQGLPLPFGELEAESFNIVGAGADTTSVSINAILGCLIQNPRTMTKLQQEIDTYYDRNSMANHQIKYNQCLEMPLLQAVIKEGMRLHPSIQFQLPRDVPSEGVTIGGYYIPSGCAVGISPKSHNRSKEIFGKDADEFRPERWLEDEARAKYMDGLLTTWGYGSRVCIGKNIALVEVNKFITQFLRQFDVSVVNKQQPFTLETYWFTNYKNFWVTLQERDLKGKI